jgi:hypothetical protein
MGTVLTPTKKNLKPNHNIKSCFLYRQISAVKRKQKVTKRKGLEFLFVTTTESRYCPEKGDGRPHTW